MNRRRFLSTALAGVAAMATAMVAGTEVRGSTLEFRDWWTPEGNYSEITLDGASIGGHAPLPPTTITIPTSTIDLDSLPAYDHSAHLHSIAPVRRTGISTTTLRQSVPWTTEQIEQIHKDYLATPSVLHVMVSGSMQEGDEYVVRVVSEVAGLASLVYPA